MNPKKLVIPRGIRVLALIGVFLASVAGFNRVEAVQVLYSTDFTSDPEPPWIVGAGPIAWDMVSTVVFDTPPSITSTAFEYILPLSTDGFERIAIDMSAFQTNADWIQFDNLRVEYSTDMMTYTTIPFFVTTGASFSAGPWASNVVNGPGTTVSMSTGLLELPVAASNQPNFALRISATTNDEDTDYFIDSFQVVSIPEPSRGLFIAIGMVSPIFIRRRR